MQVIRSYRGDVSLLIDVVRQSILFDSMPELHECLSLISDDPEAHIVRIKNRLVEDYDGLEVMTDE